MADPILELPFPHKDEIDEAPTFEVQSYEEDLGDGYSMEPAPVLPAHIAELFQNLAMQTEFAPCEIMVEAQDILAGLQEGRLEYLGINEENGFVELSNMEDGSVHSLHGPHVSALMQYYGAENIFDIEAFEIGGPYSGILHDALKGNDEAYEHSIRNVSMSAMTEVMRDIVGNTEYGFPGIPQIQPCFNS